MPLEKSITLESQQNYQTEQKPTPCPLPAGEGQTDTPINRHNRGEVYYNISVDRGNAGMHSKSALIGFALKTPLPSPPRGRSQFLLRQIIDLEIQQNHQPTSPFSSS